MEKRIPYYMAYPTPLLYDDERRDRMDFEYMKSLYPDAAKKLLPYIEDECDRMEYAGSLMFDEYPDRLQLHLMCGRVYERAREKETFMKGREKGNESWLRDLIQVMVYQELYKRRCDNRKYKRKLYPVKSFPGDIVR